MRQPTLSHLVCLLAPFMLPGVGFGQRLSFGVVGGTNLTRDFHTSRFDFVDSSDSVGLSTFLLFSDSHSILAGPTMEMAFARYFAVEIDGLHRTLQLKGRSILPNGQRLDSAIGAIGTWEFPLL